MPYRIKASFGPTFRYILATTIMIIKSPRTRSPAMMTTSFGNPNIKPPFRPLRTVLIERQSEKSLLRKLFPPLHVGDSFFVALNHDFGAFLDCFASVGARAGASPHPCQRENDFARAVLPNRHAEGSERTLHTVVFALHGCVGRTDEFHHEAEDHPSSHQAGEGGDQQAD